MWGALLLVFTGCDPHDGKLTLVNTTKDTVFYTLSYDNDSFGNSPAKKLAGRIIYSNSSYIVPLSEEHYASMDKWENVVNSSKDSSLKVFFFSSSLIKSTSKDSLLTNQLYSKKMKLKVKDLEKLNWKVVYDEK
jgi:hypothetical protein